MNPIVSTYVFLTLTIIFCGAQLKKCDSGHIPPDCAPFNDGAWCVPIDYDRTEPPIDIDAKKALEMEIIHDIQEISSISDKEQAFSVKLFLKMMWIDERICIDLDHKRWKLTDEVYVKLENIYSSLWIPDLEFYGLEDYHSTSVLGNRPGGAIMYNNSKIEITLRLTIKVACTMDFKYYPFDAHECYFRAGSFNFRDNELTFISSFQQPQREQRYLGYNIEILGLRQYEKVIYLASTRKGNYAVSGFKVTIARNYMQMVFQIFIPCSIFVIVSWASFSISPEIVPGRMGLLIALFLVMINMFNAYKDGSIPATTFNTMDIFFLAGIVMVFLAIAEYAVVLAIIKRADGIRLAKTRRMLQRQLTLQQQERKKDINSSSLPELMSNIDHEFHGDQRTKDTTSTGLQESSLSLSSEEDEFYVEGDDQRVGPISVTTIDKIATMILPIVYGLFNLYYWTSNLSRRG